MTDENRVLPATESDGVESSSKSLTSDPLMNLSNISTAVLKGPTVGQQLRTAREAKGLSASEVAHALKLSVHQVLSLENDDWSSLPGTIVRGFIRNYARLLNLSSEALMDQLDVLRMPPPQLDIPSGTSTALPQTSRVERRDLAVMFFGLMLLILALLAYFFVPQDFWQSRLAGLSQSAPPPKLTVSETVSSDSLPPSSASDQVAPLGATASPSIEASPQVSLASLASPEPVQSANPPSSSVSSLKLSFSRSSWVEIRDRSGQVIFSQLNPAGSEREIEGQPPFALVVGNASGVTVQYKGKSIEMPLRSKEDVARFNIE